MSFIDDEFLLHSAAARRLYHDFAEHEPILDFHSHLPAKEIADDRRFNNLTELCLEGDHYKWRLMRANGVPERLCTGSASFFEKFQAWAGTVPFTLRNPLYHWTHLELKRYFDIDCLLNQSTAGSVWDRAQKYLDSPEFSAKGILKKFCVKALCTTDDPCDDLSSHGAVNSIESELRMFPTFRPDRALQIDDPQAFNPWVARLERASNVEISSLQTFLDALQQRHEAFHGAGGRLSDHGIPHCYGKPCTETKAAEIFTKARRGHPPSREEHEQFSSLLMLFFGRLDAEKGWTKQLHLGALRAVNSKMLHALGRDTGFDCVGDWPQAEALCVYLDLLARENALPKMILYNLNPRDNYVFSTAAGSFQDGSEPGKIQFGSAWWFLDQKDGIEDQLKILSNVGLLSRFVGMLTDSRSFMSFPRHEYFRRILCNRIGAEMQSGELPCDFDLVGGMVRNICFMNAKQFLGLDLPDSGA